MKGLGLFKDLDAFQLNNFKGDLYHPIHCINKIPLLN